MSETPITGTTHPYMLENLRPGVEYRRWTEDLNDYQRWRDGTLMYRFHTLADAVNGQVRLYGESGRYVIYRWEQGRGWRLVSIHDECLT